MQQKTILVVGLNSRNDGHINTSPAFNFQTSLFHVEILILFFRNRECFFSLSFYSYLLFYFNFDFFMFLFYLNQLKKEKLGGWLKE